MNVLEAIDLLPDDQKLKVGSQSGFFYVGTVEQFRYNINKIDSKCREYQERLFKTAEKNLKSARNNKPNPDECDDYDSELEAWEKKIVRLQKLVKKHEGRLRRYVPLIKRNVNDSGMCLPESDPEVYRVVIDGYEVGAFWTLSEIMFVKFVFGD